MPKIKPITDLRDTTALSKEINESDEPIFITKNGNLDFIMMNEKMYKSLSFANNNPTLNNLEKVHLENLKKSKEHKTYNNKIYSSTNKNNNLGFVKVGCATYKVDIGNVKSNLNLIKENINEALKDNIDVLVFPELCLTGYTCNDLFYYPHLLDEVILALQDLEEFSTNKNIFFVVGAPIAYNAADEVAVAAFMEERISFKDISRIVGSVIEMDCFKSPVFDYSSTMEMDRIARKEAEKLI